MADPDEYKPIPRACDDFAFINQRLRELERDREEALKKQAEKTTNG